MQKQAKITSNGQITVPRNVRRALEVQAGDHLVFESFGQDIIVRGVKTKRSFSKYRGIGNPEWALGRRGASICLVMPPTHPFRPYGGIQGGR